MFEAGASITYESVSPTTTVTENGVDLNGYYGKDSFGMGRDKKAKVDGMEFFLATEVMPPSRTLTLDGIKEINGVIGLSNSYSSSTTTNYIDLLYTSGLIPAPVFSLALGGEGKQSSITLGESNTDYVKSGSDYEEFDA